MTKLIVLKFDGDFESQGFHVNLEIGEENRLPQTTSIARLPAVPELLSCFNNWHSNYHRLCMLTRWQLNYRIVPQEIIYGDSINAQLEECRRSAKKLESCMTTWLKSESFRCIDVILREKLNPNENIRVLISTKNSQIQKLPWHLWDFFKSYRKAEFALSPREWDTPSIPGLSSRSRVKVLAILGNSTNINTHSDQDLLKKKLNDKAEILFLENPQRQELNEHLWEQKWNILFFAGHSKTEGDNGRIFINQKDSLTIDELKNSLQAAISHGLQIAIFNSCDGLGIAQQLASLNIPQIIVMREPVPDLVAQDFLKYFLTAFARGESLYLALREAREKLQGLEDEFPNATWLPVIYQNPSQTPPTWQEILKPPRNIIEPPPPDKPFRLLFCLFASLIVTSVIIAVRSQGAFKIPELWAYDLLMRAKPAPELDPNILMITVDDDDVRQFGKPLSDRIVDQILIKLEKYKPRVIGLDIYRDAPQKEGWDNLVKHLQQSDRVIALCRVGDINDQGQAYLSIAPPPKVPPERYGFSDAFSLDSDEIIRRYSLTMSQRAGSSCPTQYSFSFQIVRRYLPPETQYSFKEDLWINSVKIKILKPGFGAYQDFSNRMLGYQVQIDYRPVDQVAPKISLTDFLNSSDSNLGKLIKNKIVLIGYVGKNSAKGDFHPTPLGQMPGVVIHAQMVSQILSILSDHKPILSSWERLDHALWIWSWSVVGGLLVWRFQSPRGLRIVIGVALVGLGGSCFFFFIQGVWLPIIPSVVALVMTFSTVNLVVYLKSRIPQ